MASIDKIYGTLAQYDELHAWLSAHKPEYLRYLYSRDMGASIHDHENYTRPISNFSTEADKWLYKNCPLEWVRVRIHEQYEGEP